MLVNLATDGVKASNGELTEATDVALYASHDLVLVHLYHLSRQANLTKLSGYANKSSMIKPHSTVNNVVGPVWHIS